MKETENVFVWLQKWYSSQCDGDWEHEFGVTIDTVDNPGWYVTINLRGTLLENCSFTPIEIETDEMNWFFCLKRDDKFESSCSPLYLTKVLQIFQEWAEKCEKEKGL